MDAEHGSSRMDENAAASASSSQVAPQRRGRRLLGRTSVRRAALLASVVPAFAIISCAEPQKGPPMPETFNWLPTECAPARYPMYLLKGDLVYPNGESIYIPDQRAVNNGWGEHGSSHLVEPEFKPVPSALDITWFSFVENRFYAGRFELPYKRLQELFELGVASADAEERWPIDRIVVGMAPGGDVSVWVGARAIVKEVAMFRAQPADLPWSAVQDDPETSRHAFIELWLAETLEPEVLAEVRRAPIPAGRWTSYSKRYAWSPRLLAGVRGRDLWVRGLNGEVEWLDVSGTRTDVDPPPSTRAIPESLTLLWTTQEGVALSVEITLDEAESMAAFAKLESAPAEGPIELMIDPSEQGEHPTVLLKRGRFVLRLERLATAVYLAD